MITLGTTQQFSLLISLSVILVVAHSMGFIFVRLRQPRVAGEIFGGLLLGPSLLGWLHPAWTFQLLGGAGPTSAVLAAIYQLGQFLLMFCAGAALRPSQRGGELRATGLIALIGNALPFGAGLAFVSLHSPGDLLGSAGNESAFILVFACAIAVTSIPVISRIMADLHILGTSFARVVLSVAVLEDFVLYIVLSVAIGLVAQPHSQGLTLANTLSIRPGTAGAIIYYVAVSLAFFGLPLILGRSFAARLGQLRTNLLVRGNALAFQVVFMMALTAIALLLGVSPIFGAFIAGILSGSLPEAAARARTSIESFSFGFFIPIYFALVGLQLDLVHQFDVPFFVLFLIYACIVKAASVYLGARLAGEVKNDALNLAIALNARGGPAIVLATAAFAAHIISARFFVDLVLLALITSMMAGGWLARSIRRGTFLPSEPDAAIDAADGDATTLGRVVA